MEIKFVTKDPIQPKGGLILEPLAAEDYILGANDPKNLGQVLVENGDWTPYLPAINEIQRLNVPDPRTGEIDTYWCTIFSDNEIDETIHKRKYGTEINISDKFVAIGAGTQRGVGNTMKAAAEFKRKKGFLFEDELPFNRAGTMDEAYSLNTAENLAKAFTRLAQFETGYLSTGSTGQEDIINALKVSPVKIAVEGRYVFDAQGRLMTTGSGYNHAVMLFNAPRNENGDIIEYHTRCSETNQYLKMRADYAFVSPLVKTFEKKSLMPKIYKQIGSPALYIKHWSQDLLIPIADGVLVGGDLFKTLLGSEDYASIPRVKNNGSDWANLPYPIAPYSFLTR